MKNLISLIAQGKCYEPNKVEGYSEDEIYKLEKLYDINIVGNFRLFMREMGRCSGGLLGDDTFLLYSDRSVRIHMINQIGFREEIANLTINTSLELYRQYCNGAFFIVTESETQHYYLNTKSDQPERVFHFDENTDKLEDTGYEFIDYLADLVRRYGEDAKHYSGIICKGELLNIV